MATKLYRAYKKEAGRPVATVKEKPFDGAEEIDVMTWDEIVGQLQAYYDDNGHGIYDAEGVLTEICQQGEGPDAAPETEYTETWFVPPYCSEAERDLQRCFYGDRIYAYSQVIRDEDGEIDFTGKNFYRVA